MCVYIYIYTGVNSHQSNADKIGEPDPSKSFSRYSVDTEFIRMS